MDFLIFIKDLRLKNRVYCEIWLNILMQYNDEKEKIINIYPVPEVHQRTFYRIIDYGILSFNNHIKNYKITKQRSKILIEKISYQELKPKKARKENNKSVESNEQTLFIEKVILYLNEKSGNNFSSKLKIAIRNISSRLEEGYSFEDFKKVIDIKCENWKGTKYEQYLTPSTLFGDKFGIYVNEKQISQKTNLQKNYDKVVEATELGWNHKPRNN